MRFPFSIRPLSDDRPVGGDGAGAEGTSTGRHRSSLGGGACGRRLHRRVSGSQAVYVEGEAEEVPAEGHDRAVGAYSERSVGSGIGLTFVTASIGGAGVWSVDAVAGADEAGLVGEHDELSPVADSELHHRSVDMRLDRQR